MIMQDVVVTGLGLVTALAGTPNELFHHLENGLSCVRNNADYKGYGFKNAASAFIDSAIWERVDRHLVNDKNMSMFGPQVKLACFAGDQAITQSGLSRNVEKIRNGVFVGSNKFTFNEHHLDNIVRFYDRDDDTVNLDGFILKGHHNKDSFYHKRADLAAMVLSDRYSMRNIVMTHGDACAAGGIAIGTAYRHIKHNELEVALAGATETMCNFIPLVSFSVLGATSQNISEEPAKISRPFDKARSGFVMGEGSAFVVLESLRHAQERGARILARVAGFSKLSEAWRITASPPDGSEYARCMRGALQDAGLLPEDIDHINAHGTSTITNDACECAAIREVFQEKASKIPVTANKSATGHSLATSGALEAVLSILSMEQGLLLPTLNFTDFGEGCDNLNIVVRPQRTVVRTVMSNSFGFGGENCSLILQTYEEKRNSSAR